MHSFQALFVCAILLLSSVLQAEEAKPVYLGFDGEFGVEQSTPTFHLQAVWAIILKASDFQQTVEITQQFGTFHGRLPHPGFNDMTAPLRLR